MKNDWKMPTVNDPNNNTTLLYLKGIVYYGEIILHLELYPKMAKYGSMMKLQLEAKVLRTILLQWQTKILEKCKGKDLVLAVYACNL